MFYPQVTVNPLTLSNTSTASRSFLNERVNVLKSRQWTVRGTRPSNVWGNRITSDMRGYGSQDNTFKHCQFTQETCDAHPHLVVCVSVMTEDQVMRGQVQRPCRRLPCSPPTYVLNLILGQSKYLPLYRTNTYLCNFDIVHGSRGEGQKAGSAS